MRGSFYSIFEYGNREGKEDYCTYEHMVIQLENCMDVLHITNGYRYSYIFLFYHFCGHDRMSEDSININRTNIEYGGDVPHMRPSVIKKEDGFLG